MPLDGNKPTVAPKPIVGILVENDGKLQIHPANVKGRSTHRNVDVVDLGGAKEGDIVVAKGLHYSSNNVPVDANVTKILGTRETPHILSLVSLYEQGISPAFNDAVMKEVAEMKVPELGDREDLRSIPLVTIDGADSRDFDDAVFAEKTADGGFHLIVAIADVSWYVRPGMETDKEAYHRGNSVYLPDMVIPMLPEEVSNGICSLKPGEDRAVMAYHLWIDKDGQLVNKKVNRALMHSAARLTYQQVQEAMDGKPDATTAPLMEKVIKPLYDVYAVLRKARNERGALDLGSRELAFEFNDKGQVINISDYVHRISNEVIEETAVLANAAGDRVLEEKKAPALHRNHGAPSFQDIEASDPRNKVEQLRLYLKQFGLELPPGKITHPAQFKDVLEKAKALPNADEITTAIVRVQSKAEYSPVNLGHFGLGMLPNYGHQTSPIRRYADIFNHRSHVDAGNMGEGGLSAAEKESSLSIAEHLNATEKAAKKVERAIDDRLVADYLSHKIGSRYDAKITGVANGGVFVRIEGINIEGMVTLSNIGPRDIYKVDRTARTVTGDKTGKVFKVGDKMKVRVVDADALTAGVILAAVNDNVRGGARPAATKKSKQSHHGKNRSPKHG